MRERVPVYEITDYDPAWPARFEEEKAKILAALGEHVVTIEHVGSTAVPNLGAKPIVDITVGVRSLAEAPACIAALERLGYRYVPEYEVELPERRYFRKRPAEEQWFNLHMVETTSDFWRRHLLFRDWLRAHPNDARRYEELKRRLASEATSRRAYTDAKAAFVGEIEERARASRL